jgi:hypothetical protein
MLLIAAATASDAKAATATFINTTVDDATITMHIQGGGGTTVGPEYVASMDTEVLTVDEGFYLIEVFKNGGGSERVADQWVGDELDGGYVYVIE